MTRRRLLMVLTIVFAVMATACSSGANPEPEVTQPPATVASALETTTTTTATLETTTTVATTTTAIAEPKGGEFVGNCEGVSHEAAETAFGAPLGPLTEDEYEDAGITVHRCLWPGERGDLSVIVSPAQGEFADEVASLTTGCEGGVVDGVGDEAAGYVCEYPAALGGGFIGILIVRVGDLTVQGNLKNSDTFDLLIPFLADAVLPAILTPKS